MSRYIDADAFEVFGYNKTEGASKEYNDGFDDGVQYVLECIDNVPTADVVEVVRCKDCNHWIDRECQIFSMMMNDDDYCCYGESTSWS